MTCGKILDDKNLDAINAVSGKQKFNELYKQHMRVNHGHC